MCVRVDDIPSRCNTDKLGLVAKAGVTPLSIRRRTEWISFRRTELSSVRALVRG